MKGNKGEWSEPYVLIKLLVDGKLVQGERDLSDSIEEPYKVIAVSRDEKVGDIIIEKLYSRGVSKVNIFNNGVLIREMSIDDLALGLKSLFEEISQMSGASALSENLKSILVKANVETIKADSKQKADIDVTIRDPYTVADHKLGFSIKSQLGSPSTLINSSKNNTNLRYRLSGSISEEQIAFVNQINSQSKVRERLSFLNEIGVDLVYDTALGEVYEGNLMLIDRDLAPILSECLVMHYSGFSSSLQEIADELDLRNPLDYPLRESVSYYSFKLKRYLSESALGMMPAKEWTGKHHATGGYIIVKKDGELVSYHLLRKNLFEDYLLFNTKFETPSTSRHNFGEIYKIDDNYFINLNLQIRFKH